MAADIEQLEEAFHQDPRDQDAFEALQQAYEDTARSHDLAILLERRAAHLEGITGATDMLWHAAQLYSQWEEPEAEIRVLSKALDLDRSGPNVRERLKVLLTSQERWAELIRILEQQAEELSGDDDNKARVAEIEHQMGEIWENHLCRLDQALQHYQAAFNADGARSESIEAGRRVYETVGHWEGMASLFQLELSLCTKAKRKAALLVELGRLQWKKMRDMETAARCFNDASHLKPGDEAVQEALGDVYSEPDWPYPDGLEKAASIFVKIAQRRESQGDRDGAISFLRRALGANPANEAAYIRLERTYQDTGRWEDLDSLYQQRLGVAGERERVALALQRADVLERKLGDRDRARKCYEEALEHEGAGGDAAGRLLEIYRADKDHDRLANLLQDVLSIPSNQETRIRHMMELAGLFAEHLDDVESAARLFFEVLQLDPAIDKAQQGYKDYFKHKGDFRNLAELARFCAQYAMDSGAPQLEICAVLEELAEISERRLGDLEGAVEAWQQIALLHPDVQRSRESLGRLNLQMKRWHHMVEAMEREVEQAVTPAQRLQSLRKAAKAYYEWQVNPERTMELLHEILRQSPQDDGALRMLVDICERESDFAGLAAALEGQLEGIMTKVERISVLRRLGDLHSEKLHNPDAALKAYQNLLDLVPSDKRVYQRVLDIMEGQQRHDALAQFLQHRTQLSRSVAERLAALKKLAQLLEQQLEDPARSITIWEQVRDLEARDVDALEALARLYADHQRHHDLLGCLTQRLELMHEAPAVERAELLHRIATLAEDKLDQPQEAIRAYEKLAEIMPADRQGQDALTRLYNKLGRFSDLVAVLQRQLEQCDDPEQRVVLAFKQADVLEEKLSDLDAAARLFEQLISEHSPADLDAHHRLKELHLRRGDYQRACEVSERELFLMPADDVERTGLALEIARLWHEKAGDDQRALLAHERVLELDPDNRDALLALRLLYRRTGSHNRLVKMAQVIFAALDDAAERMELLLEVGEVYEKGLFDPETAFSWYRRAHDLFPAEHAALDQLRRLAREYNLWEDLILVLLETRKQHAEADPDQFLELTFQVATICEEELSDPRTAFEELEQGLLMDPTGEQVLPHLERLAEAASEQRRLLDVYDRVVGAVKEPGNRRDLLARRVKLASERLGDSSMALTDSIRLFQLDPTDEDVAQRIDQLAEESGRWGDVVEVYEERVEAAEDADNKVERCWQLAALFEQRLSDHQRAFETLLAAFALRPHDTTTVDGLWRLARILCAGEGGPAPAEQPPQADAPGPGDTLWEPGDAEPEAGEDSTQEIDLEDMVAEVEAGAEDGEAIDESPTELAVEVDLAGLEPDDEPTLDLEEDQIMARGDSTGEIDLDGDATDLVAVQQVLAEGDAAQPAQALVTVVPWEELARAYLELPAPDRQTRIQLLLQVAEIWKDGAGDVDRAMQVLADASAIDAEDTEVEQRLLELAVQYDRFDDVLRIYNDALEQATDADELVRLQLRVAGLLWERGRLEEAEQHLVAVLELRPQDGDATSQLEEILLRGERWEELANLKERMLAAGPAGALDDEQREARLRELADLLDRVDAPQRSREVLSHLAALDPADTGVLERLADAHEQLTDWADMVEVLETLVELTDAPQPRARHQARLAAVYQRELDLPDRAIELYKHVINAEPSNTDAMHALTSLYEGLDQTDELVEVLNMRVDLVGEDLAALRPLLMELSRIHERRGDLEAAVAYLQRVRSMTSGEADLELEQALAEVLIQAGRPEEAADLVQAQSRAALEAGRPAEEVMPLLLRQAQIQDQLLGDSRSARQTLEYALTLCPQHVDALQALAQHFLRQEAWAAYVEVLERLIETRPADAEAVASLMAAGRIMEDQEQDLERAGQIYQRVLVMDPTYLPALDALLELGTEEPQSQDRLLSQKLELVQDPAAQAGVLVAQASLAATQQEPERASGLLQQALELEEDYIPALDALSLLMRDQGQLDSARLLLEDALTRLDRSPQTGQLSYRLGMIYQQLERPDEAHTFLLEAHRRNPDDLQLRMALGDNRFRAERWREALTYLEAVLDHPAAKDLPEQAAAALEAAGTCALELGRDDRATLYLEAALDLDPRRADALQTLAVMALSDGEHQRASELMQRELTMAADTARQHALLQQLGDLHRDQLHDMDQAAQYYEELYQGLGNDEATRLEVLPRLLPIFREADRHEAAAEVAEDLVRMLGERKEQRDMLLIAAAEREAAGSLHAAEGHRWSALELDPGNIEAATALCRALSAEGRHQEVVDLTTHLFATQPAPRGAQQRRDHAALHSAQGYGLRRLGDERGAMESLEHSLSMAESMDVRQVLAGLYGERPEFSAIALANHRRLLSCDGTRLDSLRAIARATAAEGPHRAATMYQALHLLSPTPDEDAAAFLADYEPPEVELETPYPGSIEQQDRTNMMALPEAFAMHEVFELVLPQVPALLSLDLESLGVSADCKISQLDEGTLARVYSAAARALGVKNTAVYVRFGLSSAVEAPSMEQTVEQELPVGIEVAAVAPPAVILPAGLEARRTVDELRFLLGRALELTHPAFVLAAGVEPGDFARLMSLVLRAFHPRHMKGRRDLSAEAREEVSVFRRALPFKVARRLGEIFRDQADEPFSSAAWRRAALLSANRAGLVLCGDLEVAFRMVLEQDEGLDPEATAAEQVQRSPLLADLLSFALSDGYHNCRMKLMGLD